MIKINASSAYGELGAESIRFTNNIKISDINNVEQQFISDGLWYKYIEVKIGILNKLYAAYVHDRFIEPMSLDKLIINIIELILRFDNISDVSKDDTLKKIRHLITNREKFEFTEKL